MSRFLYLQCLSSDVAYPRWARRWVNIRKAFCNAYGVQRAGISTMLEVLGLAFDGRPHSGRDDARNVVRILAQLIADGCNVYENEKLVMKNSPLPTSADDARAAEVAVLPPDTEAGAVDDDDDVDDAEAVHISAAVGDSALPLKAEHDNNTRVLTGQAHDDAVNCASMLQKFSV